MIFLSCFGQTPFRRAALWCGAFLLFSFLYCRYLLPETAVWITDNGSKYMILHNLAETGEVRFDHPLPDFFPCGGFHFLRTEQGIFPFHPAHLARWTLPWYAVGGDFGAHFLPWLAGIGLILLIVRYGRNPWTAPLALCATPLLFYSQLFWEMVPAAFFASAGLFLLFGRRPAWGGFLLGAGAWMREELYVVLFAVAAVLMLERDWKTLLRCALGALLPILALWAYNAHCDGNILGIHGKTYRLNNRPQEAAGFFNYVRETVSNFHQHLFRFAYSERGWNGVAASMLLIGAGCLKDQRIKVIAGLLFAVIMTILTAALFFHPSPLYLCARTAGLFPSIPAAAGFCLFGRKLLLSPKRGIRLLSRVCALVILIIPFLLSPHDIGLTWGARHYCVIMPVQMTLSIYAFGKAGWLKGKRALLPWTLVIISLVMQFYAMRTQIRVTREAAALDRALCAMPTKIVLTDAFYLPEETPCAFREKLFLEIVTPEQAEKMSTMLPSGTEFTLVIAPDFRRLPNPALKRLMQKVKILAPPQRFSIGGTMETYLFPCRKIR